MSAAQTRFESENPETPVGRQLYGRLTEVHGAIRRDLDSVVQLIDDVESGISAQAVSDRVEALQTNGPLWKLKTDCLQFCTFLHTHHTHEDNGLFPRLRELNPDLAPAVAKLEADHEQVAALLVEVEAATESLREDDSSAARALLTEQLTAMRNLLDGHLEYEEIIAGPTIRRLVAYP